MPSARHIHWSGIDTVLLDMDGTLLDLAFDNRFWLELVPEEYARAHGIGREEAGQRFSALSASVFGKLDWYCLDHWTEQLGIGIRELKWANRHFIAYLPRVPEVLRLLRRNGKRLVIVTNAHRDTLAVKLRQTRLDIFVDGIVCSHDYGVEKESPAFWQRLAADEPFDAARTVLVDDSEAVLGTAAAFGLENLLAVRRPDSGRPPRVIEGVASIDGLAELTTLGAC